MVKRSKLALFIIAVCFSVFVNIYKLDFPYMFTDEILYVQAGQEYKKSDYTLNLQHPLLGKYVSAITSGSNSTNVFNLRLPFAILGVLSGILVYLIIKSEMGSYWATLGMLTYSSMPFLHETNRATLLDSPMHFFWLLFSYYFLKFCRTGKLRILYVSAVMLGLAMSVKFTSVVLIFPICATILFGFYKRTLNYVPRFYSALVFVAISLSVFLLHYTHLVVVRGLDGVVSVLRAFKDVILSRNAEGKLHVINGQLYDMSPWWFYLHYIKERYGVFAVFIAGAAATFGIKKLTLWSAYWFSFFLSVVIYFQALPLKNSRYISSMELLLTFLIITGINFLYTKRRSLFYVVLIALFLIMYRTVAKTAYAEPTSYHAAYLRIHDMTLDFKNGERILIFGSVRTSKWYFKDSTDDEDRIVIRKDLEPLRNELYDFKYILVDTLEKLKYPNSILFTHLDINKDRYDRVIYDNLILYVLKT